MAPVDGDLGYTATQRSDEEVRKGTLDDDVERSRGAVAMRNASVRFGVMIALTIVFGLAGAAWGAPCGDPDPPGEPVDRPCSCGDTVTTDTTLNLGDPVVFTGAGDTVCPGVGLFVAAGVALNLGGHEIRGDEGPCSDVGIQILGNEVEIRNGDVNRFGTGVGTATTTDDSIIRNVRFRKNTCEAIEGAGDHNLIRANRMGQNGSGITWVGNYNVLLRNQARENTPGPGIRVHGSGNDLDENVARDNGADGICVTNPSGPPNIDTGGNKAKGNTPTDCTFQCEIDGAPCTD